VAATASAFTNTTFAGIAGEFMKFPELTDKSTVFQVFLLIWYHYYSPEAVELYGETRG